MPPFLHPSVPLSKEPPDKSNTYLPLAGPPTTTNTSTLITPDQQGQAPASPTIRPPFNPFFTLIHDTATSTTHHPRNVHYIFSDDDPSLLTTTCLSALTPSAHLPPPPTTTTTTTSSTSSSTTSKSPAPATTNPLNPGVRSLDNRILLLDLSPSGTSITAAHSLSSSWQIVSTSLTPAPTWDDSSPSETHPASSTAAASTTATLPSGGNNGGFMLKIAGTDGRMLGGAAGIGLGLGEKGRGDRKGDKEEAVSEMELQSLMVEFEMRMRVLRTVVEAGRDVERREERIIADGEGEEEAAVKEEGGLDVVGDA